MSDRWPALPLREWKDTYATLHMYSQVVGKIALALTPRVNHFWNVTFDVTPRGLSTHLLTAGTRALRIEFDFLAHALVFHCSDGGSDRFPLAARPVAEFYHDVMRALGRLGVDVRIWTMPVEVPDPIRFEKDTVHASYDPPQATAFWKALLAMTPVFESFRARFLGKSSPVHFFWGSFDLACTRFSGRPAPDRPGADAITREAYSHEVISHGFWPGGGAVQEAAFYGYAAPEPAGLRNALLRPNAATYNTDLSEFLLPYDAVRQARSPEADLLGFLQSTYEVAADLAGWDRRLLERS
jgi:uncharacterized protein DUF5996